MATRLIIATGNPHKVDELRALLGSLGVPVMGAEAVGGMPFVDEVGDTFLANARLKAHALLPKLQSDDWVVADDSGLAVDALGGRPGVHSARYAGKGATDGANMARLLEELRPHPPETWSARFVCTLVCLSAHGPEAVFTGEMPGRIVDTPRGTRGFGYDPIFVPDGWKGSLAQAEAEEKNRHSHRARAAQALRDWWPRR